jgi:hypothetical protein
VCNDINDIASTLILPCLKDLDFALDVGYLCNQVERIDIRRSSKSIYVEYQDIKGQNKMEFYIRATGTTYALDPKQTNDYIKERWKGR